MTMQLSVVVCTYNRAALLRRLLDSLANAYAPEGHATEVLVIANACSDDTYQLLRESEGWLMPAGLRLHWAEEPTQGKSHALNRALDLLEGDAAIFIDDDHRVDANFLVNIAHGLRNHPEVNTLCGRIVPDWDGREPAWVHDEGQYRIYPPPIPIFDAGSAPRFLDGAGFKPGGGNLIVRRSLLTELGHFSTELGPRGHDLGGGEDSEFLKRALDAGERLLYLPDILQYHYVDLERLQLQRLLRLSYERSRASARLQGPHVGVPGYLWRKLGEYLASAIFSLNPRRTRFYLIRCAAALGEIKGVRESRSGASAT
jgi:glycosyltransferase involved in cell wall biosynthesis